MLFRSRSARDEFYPYYRSYFADGLGRHLDRAAFEQVADPDGPLVVGIPTEVTAKIIRIPELLGIDRFLDQVDLSGLPMNAVRTSICRLAEDVAPALRAS